MENNIIPDKQLKLLKATWTFIGGFLTVIGLLSLYGNIIEITFHEWIERFVLSFRSFFYPIVDFLNFFNINLVDGQKDILALVFFIGNRYIGIMLDRSLSDEYGIEYWQKRLRVSKKTTLFLIKLFVNLLFIFLCLSASWVMFFSEGVNKLEKSVFVVWLIFGLFFLPVFLLIFQFSFSVLNPRQRILINKIKYHFKPKFKFLRKIIMAKDDFENNKLDYKYYLKAYIKSFLVNLVIVLLTILILGLNYQLYLRG